MLFSSLIFTKQMYTMPMVRSACPIFHFFKHIGRSYWAADIVQDIQYSDNLSFYRCEREPLGKTAFIGHVVDRKRTGA